MRKIAALTGLCLALLAPAPAGAVEIDSLRAKVERGRTEAEQLLSRIRAGAEELIAARAEAEAAGERADRVGALLASGEARAAELADGVAAADRRLRRERVRLRRARALLAARLVAIYKSGGSGPLDAVLSSEDAETLGLRNDYLERIEESDAALADRVEEVRDGVAGDLRVLERRKRRADAHAARLAAAHASVSAVRDRAAASAGRLEALSAERRAALAGLEDRIEGWVADIEKAEAESRAAAEETVGRWLGGPYSIPTYIVMCESGGNYGALNPSSGAGGAYQIIPSTWAAYGGRGAPHTAPKAEQDRIAAEIWADSGGSAWVCAG